MKRNELASSWIEYFRRSNLLLKRFHGLDRTLCLLVMSMLIQAHAEGGAVSYEEIAVVAGSYTSPSTIRRYLIAMARQNLAVPIEDRRALRYTATPALLSLYTQHAEAVAALISAYAI